MPSNKSLSKIEKKASKKDFCDSNLQIKNSYEKKQLKANFTAKALFKLRNFKR